MVKFKRVKTTKNQGKSVKVNSDKDHHKGNKLADRLDRIFANFREHDENASESDASDNSQSVTDDEVNPEPVAYGKGRPQHSQPKNNKGINKEKKRSMDVNPGNTTVDERNDPEAISLGSSVGDRSYMEYVESL